MTGPRRPEPGEPRARRLPGGWIVLGGSVLASFIWWLLMQPPKRAEPLPPAATTAPAPETPEPVAAPDKTPSRPRAGKLAVEAPAPEPATPLPAATPLLRVTGDVAGADVFIDRTFVGKTPLETRDVKAGGHRINVSAEGYDGVSRDVEVLPNSPTEFTFALKAAVLDASVQVVHKHRLGSCEGRLSADLSGVRFAPTAGDDGFHAPLSGLETFSLDNKQKLLRLKVKGGKNFNFTTKAESADPLVVFHRDVEKARKKLSGGA